MNIVFIGATRFGLRCLEAARRIEAVNIVGAVTAPAQFKISYRPQGVTNFLHADVATVCATHRIPCQVVGIKGMRSDDLLDRVKAWRPDAFLVAGWFHMVPKSWRKLAPAYGLHASLLPDYSGGAPLVWAMIRGEEQTGITLFELGDGVDDGPIVAQSTTRISPEDDIATLYGRIEDLGIALLRRHLPRLADGSATLAIQDEGRRRVVPQRAPEDGLIDWQVPARQVHDFIRAQTRPYPGAYTNTGNCKLTIWATRRTTVSSPGAGLIGGTAERPVIGCGDGLALEILAVAVDGEDVPLSVWWKNETLI